MVETVDIFNDDTTFYIDPYESSLEKGFAVSRFGAIPANKITYAEAEKACKKSGKRICTFTELTSACLGPQRKLFSAQNEKAGIETVCNVPAADEETEEKFSKRFNILTLVEEEEEAQIEPKPTGSYPGCKTVDLEVYDLVGGVSEWSDYSEVEPDDNDQKEMPFGTSFSSTSSSLAELSSYCGVILLQSEGEYFPPDSKEAAIGFRCCSDTRPTDPFKPGFPYGE